MEIKITVYLENEFTSEYTEVEISKDQLKQLACELAKEKYSPNAWNNVQVVDDDDITIKVNAA